MGKLFVGLIFALFDVNLTMGGSVVGVLPDFVGYILIALGCREFSEVEALRRSTAVAFLAAAVGLGVWVLALMGLQIRILNLASLALCIYLTWMIAVGLGELEDALGEVMNAGLLKTVWMARVAVSVANYVLTGTGMDLLLQFALIAVNVLYMVFFYQSWMLYRKLRAERRITEWPEEDPPM